VASVAGRVAWRVGLGLLSMALPCWLDTALCVSTASALHALAIDQRTCINLSSVCVRQIQWSAIVLLSVVMSRHCVYSPAASIDTLSTGTFLLPPTLTALIFWITSIPW